MTPAHEDFTRGTTRRSGSDRSFGIVFATVFLLFGLFPLRHGRPIRPLYLAFSALVLCVALVWPSLLHIPNRLWTRFGILLGKAVNPIIAGLLFYLVFTPFAIVLRWMGKDPLSLALDRQARTYWAPRKTSEEASAMSRQF